MRPRPGPERQAAVAHRMRQLRVALLELSDVDRTALLMRAQEGLRYDEIARALDVSVSAAKVKVHRARLKLARLMDEATSQPKGRSQ